MTTLSDDELKELLAAAQVDNGIKIRNPGEIWVFINSKNIRQSTTLVPASIIYESYLEWSKDPMGERLFSKHFRKHFKIRRVRNAQCFNVAPDSFGLPDEYSISTDHHFLEPTSYRINTIDYLGVYQVYSSSKTKYYTARLALPNGKYLFAGKSYYAKDAAMAYDKLALQIYGKEAVLNFPRTWKDILDGSQGYPLKETYVKEGESRRFQDIKKAVTKIVESYFQAEVKKRIKAQGGEPEDSSK